MAKSTSTANNIHVTVHLHFMYVLPVGNLIIPLATQGRSNALRPPMITENTKKNLTEITIHHSISLDRSPRKDYLLHSIA